jgi:hypothetical protein
MRSQVDSCDCTTAKILHRYFRVALRPENMNDPDVLSIPKLDAEAFEKVEIDYSIGGICGERLQERGSEHGRRRFCRLTPPN